MHSRQKYNKGERQAGIGREEKAASREREKGRWGGWQRVKGGKYGEGERDVNERGRKRVLREGEGERKRNLGKKGVKREIL